jgi:hypothetical protein
MFEFLCGSILLLLREGQVSCLVTTQHHLAQPNMLENGVSDRFFWALIALATLLRGLA